MSLVYHIISFRITEFYCVIKNAANYPSTVCILINTVLLSLSYVTVELQRPAEVLWVFYRVSNRNLLIFRNQPVQDSDSVCLWHSLKIWSCESVMSLTGRWRTEEERKITYQLDLRYRMIYLCLISFLAHTCIQTDIVHCRPVYRK